MSVNGAIGLLGASVWGAMVLGDASIYELYLYTIDVYKRLKSSPVFAFNVENLPPKVSTLI